MGRDTACRWLGERAEAKREAASRARSAGDAVSKSATLDWSTSRMSIRDIQQPPSFCHRGRLRARALWNNLRVALVVGNATLAQGPY
jgi:hypothetical protein